MKDILKIDLGAENNLNQKSHDRNESGLINDWFDSKLKKQGLTEFKRVGHCSKGNVKIYHSVCGTTIEVNPDNFFRRKVLCRHCFQMSKNEELQGLLDSKFNKELELLDDYKTSREKVYVKHLPCRNILHRTPDYFKEKESGAKICECQKEKIIEINKNNPEYIKRNNKKFDNKLIKRGLIDYKRKSDYLDENTKIVMMHLKCGKEFEVEPKNFFRRKNKCEFCYKKSAKKKKRSLPKNEYYQNKIDIMTNKEFKLLSDYYNLSSYVKLKHNVCDYVFTVRADNFEVNKDKCPKCAGREEKHNKTIGQKIRDLELLLNDEYEIITKVFSYEDTVKVRHKKCENEFSCSVSSIYNSKDKTGIKCSVCELEHRKEEFLDKLDRTYKHKFTLRGSYKGINRPALFRHSECGGTFRVTPYYMLKAKMTTCPKCRDEIRELEFKNKLKNIHNDEYLLVGEYAGSHKKVKLQHKKCDSVFEVNTSNLFKLKTPCKECNKQIELLKRKENCINKINNKYNGLFSLKGEYLNTKTDTQFYCHDCNNTFDEKPEVLMFKNKKCPHCESGKNKG